MKPGLISPRVASSVDVLLSLGISQESVCLVGSSVLELHGLREAGDVDFAVTNDAYIALRASEMVDCLPGGTINVTDLIQVGVGRYSCLGISDEVLFTNNVYVDLIDGIRVARPELEFGAKLFRNRPKDQDDTALLLEFAMEHNDWRWDWVPISPVQNYGTAPSARNTVALLRSTVRKGRKAARHPARAARKAMDILRKRSGMVNRRKLSPSVPSVQQLDTGILLQRQFHEGLFRRYDTLVRLETMDSYLALQGGAVEKSPLSLFAPDHDVFSEYNRMQELRNGRQSAIRFQVLMASFERKNFHSDRYPVILDGDGRLKDGSHRLSGALHYGLGAVPVRFAPGKGPRNYGRGWFENHGFAKEYLERLDSLLQNQLVTTGAAFQLIVWPPAMQFENEIFEILAERHSVIAAIRNINLTNFPKFVEEIYLSDDIEQWKIQKKIYHMRKHKPAVSMFSFLIDDPRYRVKTRTESHLSDSVVQLKKEIRGRFKDRIEDYVHDITTHIGDNPAMNRDMVRVLRSHQQFDDSSGFPEFHNRQPHTNKFH